MTSSFARRSRPSEHSNRVRSTVVPTCGRVKETARARDRAPLAGPGRFRLEECLRDRYTDRVNARARTWGRGLRGALADRKSTRLNSSHITISYAVFCLKKK